jgi:protease-4
MTFSTRQRLLGWAILLACLAAIPVGVLTRSQNKEQAKPTSPESELSAFIPKQDRIVVLRLMGMIYEDDQSFSIFSSRYTPTYLRKRLYKAATDDTVKGILLRINSPGGTVPMSQELYSAVKAFRGQGKPVYVSMGDITASGGYYVASAADKIYADPGTLTGSIGVIMHLLSLEGIEKKIGVSPAVIKSGEFKDIGSSDRPMTAAEKALLQSIIMDSYDQFVSAIAAGRSMKKEAVLKLADGRIYSGRQAVKVGLIDELGGYEESLAALQKTLKEKNHYDKDYPVDDGSKGGFISQLLESTASFGAANAESSNALNTVTSIIPVSMKTQFNKQPLWLME